MGSNIVEKQVLDVDEVGPEFAWTCPYPNASKPGGMPKLLVCETDILAGRHGVAVLLVPCYWLQVIGSTLLGLNYQVQAIGSNRTGSKPLVPDHWCQGAGSRALSPEWAAEPLDLEAGLLFQIAGSRLSVPDYWFQ